MISDFEIFNLYYREILLDVHSVVAPFLASHSGKNISIGLDTMIEELGLDGNQWELFSVQKGEKKITIRLAAQLWGFHFFSSTMLLPMQLFVKFSMSLKISLDEYCQ